MRKLDKRALRGPALQQWTSGIKLTWTPDRLASALYEHQTGCFSSAAKLADAMLVDDEYAGSRERAIEAIAGAPFSVVPEDNDGEPDAASQALADDIQPLWYDMVPENELVKLIRPYLQTGAGLGTLDWESKNGKWVPYLRGLSVENLEFRSDEKNRYGMFGKWVFSSRDGEEEVTPGDGRWVLLVDGRDGWVSCAIRALGVTWLGKSQAWRDWNRYNERHGLPIVKAMVPALADSEEGFQFVRDVSSLGLDTTVGLPSNLDPEHPEVGYDLDLLEATDQSWGSFEKTIERADRKFQVYFLGSNASSELVGTQGSRAAAEASQETTKDLASSRARKISTMLREQIVGPYAQANIANPPVLPWPQWEIDPKETLETRAIGIKAMGEAVQAWKNAGYSITNIETIATEGGLEIEKSEEPEEPKDEQIRDSRNAKTDDDEEQLAEIGTSIGGRDGMVAAQEYVDDLAAYLADEANALEDVSAEQMSAILSASTGPDDLRDRLKAYVDGEEPVKLARLFEKAMLLGQYAGALSVEQDG